MSLTEQIFAQALLLAGKLDGRQESLLMVLCTAAQRGLEQRLREGLTAEDCRSDFICGASLMALAALAETDEMGAGASFSVGDLTVKKSDSVSAANCLRRQAELVMMPYLRDAFAFMGV